MLVCFSLCIATLNRSAAAQRFDEDHKELINGTHLHFRVRGFSKANPYLLILHGGPGLSAHMFYKWGESLEKKLNVVYLDQRWCGESEKPKVNRENIPSATIMAEYTIGNLLNDIEGVREFLKVPTWAVMGHSWGAMLGIEYAVAKPGSITKLILVDGLISQPITQDSILDAMQIKYEKQRIEPSVTARSEAETYLQSIETFRLMPPGEPRMSAVFELAINSYADLYFAHPEALATANQEILEILTKYNLKFTDVSSATPTAALCATSSYPSRDERSALQKVLTPTLILNGANDKVVTPSQARIAKQGIKNSKLIIFEDCGHFPFVEQPTRSTAEIIKFVNQPAR